MDYIKSMKTSVKLFSVIFHTFEKLKKNHEFQSIVGIKT